MVKTFPSESFSRMEQLKSLDEIWKRSSSERVCTNFALFSIMSWRFSTLKSCLSFIGFHWTLMDFHLISLDFHWVSLDFHWTFIGFHRTFIGRQCTFIVLSLDDSVLSLDIHLISLDFHCGDYAKQTLFHATRNGIIYCRWL